MAAGTDLIGQLFAYRDLLKLVGFVIMGIEFALLARRPRERTVLRWTNPWDREMRSASVPLVAFAVSFAMVGSIEWMGLKGDGDLTAYETLSLAATGGLFIVVVAYYCWPKPYALSESGLYIHGLFVPWDRYDRYRVNRRLMKAVLKHPLRRLTLPFPDLRTLEAFDLEARSHLRNMDEPFPMKRANDPLEGPRKGRGTRDGGSRSDPPLSDGTAHEAAPRSNRPPKGKAKRGWSQRGHPASE